MSTTLAESLNAIAAEGPTMMRSRLPNNKGQQFSEVTVADLKGAPIRGACLCDAPHDVSPVALRR